MEDGYYIPSFLDTLTKVCKEREGNCEKHVQNCIKKTNPLTLRYKALKNKEMPVCRYKTICDEINRFDFFEPYLFDREKLILDVRKPRRGKERPDDGKHL